MRSILACALIACAPCGIASAQGGGAISVTVENDFFDIVGEHSDRYYTNGIKATVLGAPDSGEQMDVLFGRLGLRLDDDKERETRFSLSLGQHIFTPEDLSVLTPDPKDRPYAGWLYVAPGVAMASPTQLNTLELQVGIVGPSARAGPAQNGYHRLIQGQEVMGWDHQLKDEFAFNLMGERRMRPRVLLRDNDDQPLVDLTESYSAALGTVEISAGAGATVRFGRGLEDDFGHARLRAGGSSTEFIRTDGNSYYLFTGLHGRAVLRDIFLDGNTFRDSASVDKRWFVPEFTAGAVVRWGQFRIGYTYVWRGEEFVGQNGEAEFGAVTATWTWDGSRRKPR